MPKGEQKRKSKKNKRMSETGMNSLFDVDAINQNPADAMDAEYQDTTDALDAENQAPADAIDAETPQPVDDAALQDAGSQDLIDQDANMQDDQGFEVIQDMDAQDTQSLEIEQEVPAQETDAWDAPNVPADDGYETSGAALDLLEAALGINAMDDADDEGSDALGLLEAALNAKDMDDAHAASVLEEFVQEEAKGDFLLEEALESVELESAQSNDSDRLFNEALSTDDGVLEDDFEVHEGVEDVLESVLASVSESAPGVPFVPGGSIAGDEAFMMGTMRRYHVWPLFITALVVFTLLTGGITYFNRTLQASQADEVAQIRQQGDAYLDEAIAFIQEADSVVVALDQAADSQITEEDIPKLEALLDQLDSTQDTLDQAIEKAQQAKEVYTEKETRGLAQHAIDAAQLRKEMLTMSSQLTTYDINAMKSALALDLAWGQIVDADTMMRTAAEIASAGGNAVADSRDYNQQALDELKQAQKTLKTVPQLLEGVDVSSLENYLKVKIQSAELALASDDAYLINDWLTANEKNDEFRAKDLKAAELAAKIPADPMSLVVSVYNTATLQLKADYKDIRSKAADADAYLRAYLGVAVQ